MKKNVLLTMAAFMFSLLSFGQISGVKTIPGDYATVAAAITALNASGVGPGGVTFNIAAGYTETFPALNSGLITATGTLANPVVFKKNGSGANPLITAATPGAGNYDYIFCIGGGDYITFDGVSVQENAANTTAAQQMEWGFAILKASATDGAQNNTIKNCTITLSGNVAGYGIYSNNYAYTAPGTVLTVTAVTGTNSNNKFYSLTFNNCYNGIYLNGFADVAPYSFYDQGNEVGKDGANTFNGLANGGSATSTYGMYVYYQNGIKLANNTFTGTVPLGSGSCYVMYLLTGTNSNVDVYNNTISLNYTGTSGAFYAIYNSGMGSGGTTNTVNYYNNSIINNTLPNHSSGTVYFLYISTGGVTANYYGNNVSNNTIGSVSATSTGSIYYSYFTSSPTTAGTTNVYNNTVSNNTRIQSALGSATTYLFYNAGTGNVCNEYNNTVNNITVNTSGITYGLYSIYNGTTKNVYNNTISNIYNTNYTTYSIYNGGSGNAYYYNNKVQNINMASGTALLYGIFQASGNNTYYYNNFIGELKAPTSSTTIYGLYVSGATAFGAYNNTIYLNATSTGTPFSVTGIYASVTPTVELRNNIVVNNSTPVGTGRSVAYQRSSVSLATYIGTSNNNDFWAGTPGASNLVFYDGTNSDQTLAAYKNRVSPRDASAVTENPPFVNITTSPYDLHVMTTVATQCESGGATVAAPVAVTTDFDGNPRYPNSGYPNNIVSPAGAPDIGADEFGGLILDLTPPNISFSPFVNTSSTSARVLTTTITDATGVPTSGTGLPRLYWKINSGIWNSVAGTWVSGSTYTFTFGAGVVLNDVVSYYIVAQDLVTTPNIGSNPLPGAVGFTANPPASASPPTTPYAYTIVGTLSGVYPVGVGQVYPTITAAVADLNLKEVIGPVTFELWDATYSSGETYPLVINAYVGASAVNTVKFKPKAGVISTITGASGTGIFMLNGCKYITIDGSNNGGTDRSLTITNTTASGTTAAIWIGSNGTGLGSSYLTIKNCNVSCGFNGASSSYAIFAGSSGALGTSGDDNDNLTIQNNSITNAYYGIYCYASVAGMDDNLVIKNNVIGSATPATSIGYYGIYLSGANAPLVSGNEVFNIISTGSLNLAGINLYASDPNAVVTGNKIHDIASNATGGWGAYGITIGYGGTFANAQIINNVIYNITTINYSVSSYMYNPFGIWIYAGTGHMIYHNSVNMTGTQFNSGTTGTLDACILIYSSSVTGLDIRDNILASGLTGMAGTQSFCIYAVAGTTFGTINNNDYWPYGTYGVLGYLGSNQATLAAWKTATAQDANSVSVDPVFTAPTNLLPTNAALGHLGTYLAAVPADYNGTFRTNPPDPGAFQFSANPAVVSIAASLVTSSSATLNGTVNAGGATVISGYDYGLTTAYGNSVAGSPASITGLSVTPFTGAVTGLLPGTLYHFRATGTSGSVIVNGSDLTFTTLITPPAVVTTPATAVTGTTATLNGTVNANGTSSTVSFDYGLTVAYGNNVAGVPLTITGSTVTASLANITGLTPNTLYHFRINGVNAGGTTNGADLTFTTAAIAPTVITTAATAITTSGATVNGTVNANNTSTTVFFDYGLTVAYGTTVNAVPPTVTGTATTNVSAVLTGLTTATTYHYRVRGVNSAGTTNGNDMTFLTGCPAVANAGAITGPASVCANSTGNVYTVGSITNAVSYTWTLPTGATITAGTGTNTITVTFGATSGNITVAGVGVCMTGTASTYAVTVNALPVPVITGPASPCVNSATNVYTTQAGMTGYTWTVSAGGLITAGATTSAITVTWSTTGAKTVTASYTNGNGCTAAAPASYAVTVNALPTPTITGTASLCQGTAGVVYTTQAGMTNYVWTVSAGGTVTAGGTATSNTVTITWNGSGAQTVSVNYANANGCSAVTATSYSVTVNPTPVPTIGSNNAPCVGSTGNMYYTEGGMTGYVWTVSTGGTIVSGQGTSAINVTWTGVGAQWVKVTYTNATACSALTPTIYNLFVNPMPNAAGSITGTATLCAGTNGVAYSCAEILNASSYTWTLPAGATIATGAGTKSITVNFATSAVSGNITVSGTNSCGNGTASPAFAVTVNPLPAAAGTITGPASVCAGSTGVTYSVSTIASATSYVWTVPAGATITSGGTTRTIVVSYGATAGTGAVSVKGTNTCGDGTVSSLNVTINALPAAPVVTANGAVLTSSASTGNQWYYEGNAIAGATGQTYTVTHNTGYYWVVVTVNGCSSPLSNKVWVVMTGQQELNGSSFNVFPVPNDGRFTMTIASPVQETFTIEIYNQLGAKIYELGDVLVNGTFEKQVDLRPIANGIYSVVFLNSEHKVVKKVLVNK